MCPSAQRIHSQRHPQARSHRGPMRQPTSTLHSRLPASPVVLSHDEGQLYQTDYSVIVRRPVKPIAKPGRVRIIAPEDEDGSTLSSQSSGRMPYTTIPPQGRTQKPNRKQPVRPITSQQVSTVIEGASSRRPRSPAIKTVPETSTNDLAKFLKSTGPPKLGLVDVNVPSKAKSLQKKVSFKFYRNSSRPPKLDVVAEKVIIKESDSYVLKTSTNGTRYYQIAVPAASEYHKELDNHVEQIVSQQTVSHPNGADDGLGMALTSPIAESAPVDIDRDLFATYRNFVQSEPSDRPSTNGSGRARPRSGRMEAHETNEASSRPTTNGSTSKRRSKDEHPPKQVANVAFHMKRPSTGRSVPENRPSSSQERSRHSRASKVGTDSSQSTPLESVTDVKVAGDPATEQPSLERVNDSRPVTATMPVSRTQSVKTITSPQAVSFATSPASIQPPPPGPAPTRALPSLPKTVGDDSTRRPGSQEKQIDLVRPDSGAFPLQTHTEPHPGSADLSDPSVPRSSLEDLEDSLAAARTRVAWTRAQRHSAVMREAGHAGDSFQSPNAGEQSPDPSMSDLESQDSSVISRATTATPVGNEADRPGSRMENLQISRKSREERVRARKMRDLQSIRARLENKKLEIDTEPPKGSFASVDNSRSPRLSGNFERRSPRLSGSFDRRGSRLSGMSQFSVIVGSDGGSSGSRLSSRLSVSGSISPTGNFRRLSREARAQLNSLSPIQTVIEQTPYLPEGVCQCGHLHSSSAESTHSPTDTPHSADATRNSMSQFSRRSLSPNSALAGRSSPHPLFDREAPRRAARRALDGGPPPTTSSLRSSASVRSSRTFTKDAEIDFRLQSMERKNLLLEAALMAVLQQGGQPKMGERPYSMVSTGLDSGIGGGGSASKRTSMASMVGGLTPLEILMERMMREGGGMGGGNGGGGGVAGARSGHGRHVSAT